MKVLNFYMFRQRDAIVRDLYNKEIDPQNVILGITLTILEYLYCQNSKLYKKHISINIVKL